MAGREIIVRILGDASSFTRATQQATGSASKFGSLFGKGLGLGAGISAFNLAGDAVSKVSDFLLDGVKAAREEQVGIARLGAALQANIPGWDGSTEAIEKNIGAMARTSGFADDEMRDSLARLVPATRNVGKAFDVQRVAMDLARFKGITLGEATDALIKVEAGQYRMLKSLGIELKTGATQTEALAAVQRVAGGQMAAYLDTAAGKTEVLNKRLEQMQEDLGGKLTGPLTTVTDKILRLFDAMDSEVPLSFQDRVIDIADVLNDLNPAMWASNVNAGIMTSAIDKAGKEAGIAAKSMDTFAESNAALRDALKPVPAAIKPTTIATMALSKAAATASAKIMGMLEMLAVLAQIRRQMGLPSGGGGILIKIPQTPVPRPTAFAAGGTTPGGSVWVGEEGPELVNLPRGSRVNTAAASRNMTSGGASTFVYAPTFSSASAAEAEAFARSVMPGLVREMRRQALL